MSALPEPCEACMSALDPCHCPPDRSERVPELHRDAYHGIVGEYVREVAPNTEADPLAVLALSLAWAGCRASGVYVVQGRDRHPALLWPLLVGGTASGRKGTADSESITVFSAISAIPRRRNGLSSGEGLIEAFLPASPTDPPPDPRVLVTESEWEGVLSRTRREGNTLSAILRDAWDQRPLSTMTVGGGREVKDHHLTVTGHITPLGLQQATSTLDVSNGFLNRFLPLLVHRPKVRPDVDDHSEHVDELASTIVERASSTAMHNGRWHLTLPARRLYASWYEEREGRIELLPERIQQATARGSAHLYRAALTYALLDDPSSGQIGEPHVRAAMALVGYADESALALFGPGRAGLDKRVMTVLAEHGGWMTREDLRVALGKPSTVHLTAALDSLKSEGLVDEFKEFTGRRGRPATQYRAVRGYAEKAELTKKGAQR